MKVKELIAKLRLMDPDADVFVQVKNSQAWTPDEFIQCDSEANGSDVTIKANTE